MNVCTLYHPRQFLSSHMCFIFSHRRHYIVFLQKSWDQYNCHNIKMNPIHAPNNHTRQHFVCVIYLQSLHCIIHISYILSCALNTMAPIWTIRCGRWCRSYGNWFGLPRHLDLFRLVGWYTTQEPTRIVRVLAGILVIFGPLYWLLFNLHSFKRKRSTHTMTWLRLEHKRGRIWRHPWIEFSLVGSYYTKLLKDIIFTYATMHQIAKSDLKQKLNGLLRGE